MIQPLLPAYGSASLADLLPSVAGAMGVPGFDNVIDLPSAHRYVVLLVDGLGHDLLRRHAPAAPVLNVEQALHHPHTVHREMVVKMGDYQGLGAPVKLSRTPASYRFAPLAEGKDFM